MSRISKKGGTAKRPLSAYMIFCQENRSVIHKTRPDLDFGQLGKEMGKRWNKMSTSKKAEFEKKSAKTRIGGGKAEKKREENRSAPSTSRSQSRHHTHHHSHRQKQRHSQRHSQKQRRGGHSSRRRRNELVECQLVSLLSDRVLVTRELMVRILKSGTDRKEDILILAQQLRTIHGQIAGVFAPRQTEAHPASVLATLLNTHTDAELSLFNALYRCFTETKGSICDSVKQASQDLDVGSKSLANFLYNFHPSLMDSFADSIFDDARKVATIRQDYYDRLLDHIQDWINTTKEMALAYLDGRWMDSMIITTKLVEISKNMAMVWAKIAVQFVPPSLVV